MGPTGTCCGATVANLALPDAPVTPEQTLLEAAALLQMTETDVLTLGRLHFILSEEVAAFLDDLPSLTRRLANTTAHEEEVSAERIRGAIRWGRTVVARQRPGCRIST